MQSVLTDGSTLVLQCAMNHTFDEHKDVFDPVFHFRCHHTLDFQRVFQLLLIAHYAERNADERRQLV